MNLIYDRYQVSLFISENGMGAIDKPDENGYVEDDYRIDYLRKHAQAVKDAIEIDFVDCFGYAWWGPLDIVSAGTGEMRKRYGFVYIVVDDDGKGSFKRIPKKSFYYYRDLIQSNAEIL